MSGRIIVRAVLTLAGVAATSLLLFIALSLLVVATQGVHADAWGALVAVTLAGVAAWLAVWACAGRNPYARPAARPITAAPMRLRAARVPLALSALVMIYMASASWTDLAARDVSRWIQLVSLAVAACWASITLARPTGTGRILALALGAYAAGEMLYTTLVLSRAPARPDIGNALMLSIMLTWLAGAGPIVAALCVLSLRGGWAGARAPSR